MAHNHYHGLSSHLDNLCQSRECKVYYMVRKAEKDHVAVAENYTRVLDGFNQARVHILYSRGCTLDGMVLG